MRVDHGKVEYLHAFVFDHTKVVVIQCERIHSQLVGGLAGGAMTSDGAKTTGVERAWRGRAARRPWLCALTIVCTKKSY